jgi:16S rRNA (guanine527-N7)-methyltransferase
MRSNTRKDPEIALTLEHDLQQLRHGASELKVPLSDRQIHRFAIYIRLLHEYTGRLHLISHGDRARIVTRHVLPSLVAYSFLAGPAMCDIGSGAGFPGVPLKIVAPEFDLVLFESVRKKAVFLMTLSRELGFTNMTVVHDRAEHYVDNRFDTILLRAVGPIKRNLKAIDRLLAPEGRAIFYKTHRIEQELKQAQTLMGKLGFTAEVHRLHTPIEERPLALVILERTANRRQ